MPGRFTFYMMMSVVAFIAMTAVWRANTAVAGVAEFDVVQLRESLIEHESDKVFMKKLEAIEAKLDAQAQHNQDVRERLIRMETTIEQTELRLRDRFHGRSHTP